MREASWFTMNAIVRDVMSSHPISVPENSSFKDLVRKFLEFHGSAFVVLADDGKVIGVVSDADMLLKEALDGGDDGMRGLITAILHRKAQEKAQGITAGDLMTSPAVTVTPDDTVERAARLMYDRRLRQVPVVDTVGRLAGIIDRTDVLAVFDRPDEDIRMEIISQVIPALSEPSWYSVIVRDGIVTLEGTPETISIGHQVLTRVRHVQGVVAVRDRLVYPAPPVPAAPGPYFHIRGHFQ
jgi:CBS domain-containing protein